jgi:hypothetical protein
MLVLVAGVKLQPLAEYRARNQHLGEPWGTEGELPAVPQAQLLMLSQVQVWSENKDACREKDVNDL